MLKKIFTGGLILLILAACSETSTNDESKGFIHETVTEGDFLLEIDSRKETYKSDEPIDIKASLVYVGQKSTVTILHAKPLKSFIVEQTDGDIKLETTVALAEVKSELQKDEPVVEKISNLSASNEYTESQIKSNEEIILPEGEYDVTVIATFEYSDEDYEIPLTIQIKVEN